MPRVCKRAKFTEPELPYCPHCDGRDLIRSGYANGRRRFRCRACKRLSYGEALPPPAYECPHCGARCLKSGRSPKGSQRYICLGCGRKNTDLYPEPPPAPGGPFPHVVTFYLGPQAAKNLSEYCNATGMSPAQAVRDIFRRGAQSPSALMGTARRVYDEFGRVERVILWKPPPSPVRLFYTQESFPDVRREAQLQRMRQSGVGARHSSVYVVWKLSVALDDLAKEGLCRTMRSRKMNHQEAARFLLANARPSLRDTSKQGR